jgi:hypothetical protein
MRCEHPECTGVHDGSRSYAEWCPRTKDRHRETTRHAQALYQGTAKGIVANVRGHAKERGNR